MGSEMCIRDRNRHVVARVSGYDLAGFIDATGKFTAHIDLSSEWRFWLRGQLDSRTGTGEGRLSIIAKQKGRRVACPKLYLVRRVFETG